MFQKTVQFIRYDVWRIRSRKLSRHHSFAVRTLRVFLLSLREFGSDNCSLRASALTFFSLLSIVPVFAMAFGIAKGFGLEQTLQVRLMERFEGQEEVVSRIIDFSRSLLENTRGGVIAGIGVAFLFWTVVRMLSNIESAFNQIWGVQKERPLSRKFTDYLSLMLICPILLVVSGSATVFITAQVGDFMHHVQFFGYLTDLVMMALRILPLAIIWGLLTFIYLFMPNTKVRLGSALVGGVFAGFIYQVVQWGYINFQLGAAKFGAIYGSFAALPLFLLWLQISWLIVLYGAEIAFAHQNEETYELEPDCLRVSPAYRKALAVWVTHKVMMRFMKMEKPVSIVDISNDLEIPIRLARNILFELCETGVLTEVKKEDDKESAFQPARPPELLTVKGVLDALEHHGIDELPLHGSVELQQIREKLKIFDLQIRNSPENVLIRDLSGKESV